MFSASSLIPGIKTAFRSSRLGLPIPFGVLQVTANLDPVSSKKVIVNFDFFKIGGLVSVFLAVHTVVFFYSV